MPDVRELLRSPLMLAPMAGGPSTPALVLAASAAGALGFLAAGYKTVDQVRAEVDAVRAGSTAPFGVNVFVPGPPTDDPGALTGYIDRLRSEGHEVGAPTWDDDGWDAKVELLVELAPPVVTFTFGAPPTDVVVALEERACTVGVTVTTPDEAVRARAAGAHFLCVQGPEAGAHRGTFGNDGDPDDRPLHRLLADVADAVALPRVAAGGLSTRDDVRRALAGGAVAVLCGTVFLRAPESGARQRHKDALADERYTETVVTRAFSGRPARGLRNRFVDDHLDAPRAYPEINNATRPLRAAADPASMSLWAGTGWRHASARPVADIVDELLP